MSEIVVTLKQEKSGGVFWPFARGAFAWIGFGVVVGVGASILDTPNPQLKPAHVFEALGEGWRAYEAAYRAKASSYGQAPLDPIPDIGTVPPPDDGIAPDPLPNTALGNPSENRN